MGTLTTRSNMVTNTRRCNRVLLVKNLVIVGSESGFSHGEVYLMKKKSDVIKLSIKKIKEP